MRVRSLPRWPHSDAGGIQKRYCTSCASGAHVKEAQTVKIIPKSLPTACLIIRSLFWRVKPQFLFHMLYIHGDGTNKHSHEQTAFLQPSILPRSLPVSYLRDHGGIEASHQKKKEHSALAVRTASPQDPLGIVRPVEHTHWPRRALCSASRERDWSSPAVHTRKRVRVLQTILTRYQHPKDVPRQHTRAFANEAVPMSLRSERLACLIVGRLSCTARATERPLRAVTFYSWTPCCTCYSRRQETLKGR